MLGGKIKSDEDFSEAIQREVGEEGGFTFLGIPYQTIIGRWRYSCDKSGEREVILTYNPVIPNNNIKVGNGVAEIVSLNIDQLERLIRDGSLDSIPIEGHLAIAPKDSLQISENDQRIKNIALEKGTRWLRHIEDYLRKRFEKIIRNKNGSLISREEFEKAYQQILSEFMRRGLEVGIRSFDLSQENSKDIRQKLTEALNSSFLGRDILYYLPQIVHYGFEWEGLNNATEGVKTFIGFLNDVFNRFLSENNITLEQYQQTLKNQEVPLDEKRKLIDELDKIFRERLREVFGLTDENNLNKAFLYVQNFFRDLSYEMKVADPQLTSGLYQDFVLVNEVNNANFGYLLSLFLGYDTKDNLDNQKLVRFEAGRHLLLLLKTILGINYYERNIENIKNGGLQLALNNFFGPIKDKLIIELESETMRIKIRERDNQKYIVDEKPTKTFTSFLRKSFEEPIEEINDFYSVSIIFYPAADNFNLDIYEKIVNKFVSYLEEQYPDATVEKSPIKTYGSRNFIQGKGIGVSGKRSGSQSERIVRGKTTISLIDGDGNGENLELTIYPFMDLQENKNGYWGWLEKIIDDKNYVVRRLLAGKDGIPSFYDLLFPPELYPAHYGHRLKSGYHN